MNIGLHIVATPIGNLDDISKRAIDCLNEADLVICENPKHSLKLLNKFGIKKKLVSLHDYNENSVIIRLSSELNRKKIALISDAGSPLISDPGYKFIKHCLKNGIYVTSIPGANAIIPALQLSGAPTNQFSFVGFFPKTNKQMIDFIKKIEQKEETSVFFVSSHKIEQCVNYLETYIKKRPISILKELTKLNEKIFHGLSNELKEKIFKEKENVKGEFVVVVEGKSLEKDEVIVSDTYTKEINKLLLKFSLTDVVEIVHKLTGISKSKIYKWVLKIKKS